MTYIYNEGICLSGLEKNLQKERIYLRIQVIHPAYVF